MSSTRFYAILFSYADVLWRKIGITPLFNKIKKLKNGKI